MTIEIAYTQHLGKRNRAQQDALWNGNALFQEHDLPVGYELAQPDGVILAVADGVSVSPFPHLASRCVIQALVDEYASRPELNAALVRRVHGHLCDQYARGRTFGASTTLVAAQFRDQGCVILNVGDSRAYRVSHSGEWLQLSRDHTVLEGLKAEGLTTPGEQYARIYDALEYCLVADDEEVDFPVHWAETPFLPGDTLLLCSDGVHDCLGEKTLQRLFLAGRPLREQVSIWRRAILSSGAPDNFSLVVARHSPPFSPLQPNTKPIRRI